MARRFYVRAFQGIAGPTAQWRTGWRRQKVITTENGQRKMTPAAKSFARVKHLYDVAERLRGVQIECLDALEVLVRYDSPETLFYLDPPYVSSTRSRWKKKAYSREMTDCDHRGLAATVLDLQGMVVLSGYRCPLYDELYGAWQRVTREARTNSHYGPATESLWLSPNAIAGKAPLFAAAGGS